MFDQIFYYFKGYLEIQVSGRQRERFINLCRSHSIRLWNIKTENSCYRACIGIGDFKQLKPIIKKTDVKIQIKERNGFPFFLFSHRKRKCFFFFMILAVLLLIILTRHIWKIDISGNHYYTDEILSEYLYHKNIKPGIRASCVDTVSLKADIRASFPRITWVSVYRSGTVINIRVKEESPVQSSQDPANTTPIDLVAEKDGKIISMITRRGVPQFKPGDKIKKGDILVKGTIPIVDDSGTVTSYDSVTADADIQVTNQIYYEKDMDLKQTAYKKVGRAGQQLYIRCPNSLYIFGLSSSKKRMTQTKILRLPVEIPLFPYLSIGLISRQNYCKTKDFLNFDDCRRALSTEFSLFSRKLEKKGVQILKNDVKIYKGENGVSSKGMLTIAEPAGIPQPGDIPTEPNLMQK